MSFDLDWESHGVVIRFSGVVTADDPGNATAAYEGDIRFDDLRYVIADYSAIAGCDAKPGDIEIVAAINFGASKSNQHIRKAIVTTSAEVMAMAEQYRKALGSAVPTRVFSTAAEARRWLAQTLP